MTYRISGLDPSAYTHLFELDDRAFARRRMVRMTVTEQPGFPCRISLDDAEVGASMLLLNHVSVAGGPYAARHAIFIGESSRRAIYEDAVPPALERRILSLRAFGDQAMMLNAELASPGEADRAIRRLFDNPAVRYIHAHNAIRGCFAAAVERA